MINTRNAAHALPLCAALCLFSGCTGHQMLAIKDRDIRDLRQQNASRQEALVKALKTIESLRAELGSTKYELRELEQKLARYSASTRLQQQTIDRLETQKAKLREQLRQSELAYERLKHTYQDIKNVLSNTVNDLAQHRLVGTPEARLSKPEESGLTGRTTGEHTRLRRKLDELRSQVIRERAAQRVATAEKAVPPTPATTPAPANEDSSPWIWRLTEEPPEVETIEPGSLAVDADAESKAADAAADEPHVLSTAFLWTLGAIPAIAVTLLMFIILVRFLNRPGRDTREAHEESIRIEAYEEESPRAPLEEESHEFSDQIEEPRPKHPDAQAVGLKRKPPVEKSADETEDTGMRPTAASSSSPQEVESPAETTFIDSLDWLDDTARPPLRRRKHSQDTEAIQLLDAVPGKPPNRPTEPEAAPPEPAAGPRRQPRPIDDDYDDGNSDTQMIEKIDDDEFSATQVLSVLGDEVPGNGDPNVIDPSGSRNQEFTDTAVLDASGIEPESAEKSQEIDDVATDTQILPPLVDFEEDSELDEALAETIAPDDEDEPMDPEGDSDSELLAELEDLMGEKFEEPAA